MVSLAIFSIVLGLVMLFFGSRLVLLASGVGALLGIGILRLLPGSQDNWLWLIIPIGLAIIFALGAGIARGLVSLATLAVGALAGGAIVLAGLELFGVDWGLINWILVLVGAVIGASLMSRFKNWAVIFLAALVGALLCVRGLQIMLPFIDGVIASLIGLVLAGGSVAYQGGFISAGQPPKQR